MPIHVVHALHTLDTGGMEKGVTTLVREASEGFEHSVICLTRSGAMARRLPKSTRVLEMHKRPGNSVRFLWRLSRAVKSLHPDIVHSRNWGGLDAVVASRMARVRCVVHGEHGWDMSDASGKSRKRQRVRRFLSRWVTEYTCVSRHIERWLRDDVGIRRPITPICNGVDTNHLRPSEVDPAIRGALGIDRDDFAIGTVGRLDPIKDFPTLFRAFERVRREVPGARLVVVGDGPERERLEGISFEGIHMIGNRQDVPALLGAFDVFALPSLNEGISNTILEAMATGLPVVATRVGGSPELIDDRESGLLVPPGDHEAIAAALLMYHRSPEARREHGDSARRATLERFSIQRMVESYEDLWVRLARKQE